MKWPVFLLISVALCVGGCKKDPVNPHKPVMVVAAPISGSVPVDTAALLPARLVIGFKAVAGNLPLTAGTIYTSSIGDQFTVTKFTYYISNIVLRTASGEVFSEPESYHLISHMEGAESFTIAGIPRKAYTSVEFMIGVDSVRNVSGAQSGALDPGNNMFWDWNTGYIFYKLEGWYRSISSSEGEYGIHVGGHGGRYKAQQQVVLPLEMKLTENAAMGVTVAADAAELFKTPHQLDFDTYFSQVQEKDIMQRFSENYRDMFTITNSFYINP